LTAVIERGVAEECHQHRLDSLWIPHLYHISESSKLWKKLADHTGKAVLLCWIHPRPALWLLRRHGIANAEMTVLNLNSLPDAAAAVSAAVEAIQAGAGASKTATRGGDVVAAPGKMERCEEPVDARWYPVMDGSRCINCGHCLQFCLFGVYGTGSDGQVDVRNPDQCKTGCPACARICPQSAIMFPLYEKDSAVAGAPGQYVALDAAARKMFYTRTGQPCPLCGAKAKRQSSAAVAAGQLCPECGRPPSAQIYSLGPAVASGRPAFDDLDVLVDQLDQRMQQRR
jgi:Pyruvate/2-oxoacid:ferredoxin oxidoreductase delta subunit